MTDTKEHVIAHISRTEQIRLRSFALEAALQLKGQAHWSGRGIIKWAEIFREYLENGNVPPRVMVAGDIKVEEPYTR